MTKCDGKCQIKYPDGCVNQMFTGTSYLNLCGQCALEKTNEIHGTKRHSFRGPQAEAARRRTLAYRQKLNDL